jgi:hypothetical protein
MTKDAYTFRYRVRNWSHYNRALIARGGLTFWIDEAALATGEIPSLLLLGLVHPGSTRIRRYTAWWSSKACTTSACEPLKGLCPP